jgi:putative ABC transport system ATP-binding protein
MEVTDMEDVLKLNQIHKIYEGKAPFQALNNISLNVASGEFIGIMGPSGAGKTTLLNLIATLERPTSGNVIINDQQLDQLNKEQLSIFRRRTLGFVFQDFVLLDTLTLEENIMMPLVLEKEDPLIIKRKVKKIAEKLGIASLLNNRPFEVSGGQKQRTGIARAIIHNPDLLLADEPTGNLDSKTSQAVLEEMLRVNEEENMTMLMVTHDPIAASYCERVIFIKDGELFNEIYKGNNRKLFFQQIIDVLSMLGGNENEFLSARY